jgi:hypothetical protein
MTVLNKLKWVVGIALIFFLILMTNLVDRQNFTVVRESIETIYADRLIAQDILYDLSGVIWEKQLFQQRGGRDSVEAQRLHTRIEEELNRFATTKLTDREARIFDNLQRSLGEMTATVTPGAAVYNRVREDMGALVDIQLQEGRRQLHASKKAIGSADLFTQLEVGVLIVLAIAVQIIVIAAPKSGGNVEESE